MKKLLLFFMTAGLLIGCSDDDKKTIRIDSHHTWSLTKLTGEMEPISFENGEYSWFIEGDILTVEAYTDKDISFILPEGDYLIEVNSNSFDIVTEGFEGTYGYSIEGEKLTVAPPGAEVDAVPYMEFNATYFYPH